MDDSREVIEEAKRRGPLSVLAAYVRLSGPGWLQSALTLGGGSLASAMYLGVIGGYELLWVQPLAMLLGVVMLSAISYVTLSIESSPFDGIRRHINPVLAWSWLLGALLANMIWALPQYALAYAVLTENLLPGVVPYADSLTSKIAVSVAIMLIVAFITMQYDRPGKGVRLYELTLKLIVGAIMACFLAVVVRMTLFGAIDWGSALAALAPNPRHLFEPTSGFQEALAGIANEPARSYWRATIVDEQRALMIAAASAAVGINMTFLMPYSLLAKGWTATHRGFAVFDLCLGLLAPFAIGTACIVLAAGSQFYTKPFEGLTIAAGEEGAIEVSLPEQGASARLRMSRDELVAMLDRRRSTPGLEGIPVTLTEARVASMLLPRDTAELAAALDSLFKETGASKTVFGLGVLAMAVSTISLLMLISGFALCEALGVERGGRWFRLGTLLASTGVLWPIVWGGASKAYLAVIVGTVGYTLLPIALVTFAAMLNSKALLGDLRPRGIARMLWNVALGAALLFTGSASLWTAWNLTLGGAPVGRYAVVALTILVAIGQIAMWRRKSPAGEPVQPQ